MLNKQARKEIRKRRGEANFKYFSPSETTTSDSVLLTNKQYVLCYRKYARRRYNIKKAILISSAVVAVTTIAEVVAIVLFVNGLQFETPM